MVCGGSFFFSILYCGLCDMFLCYLILWGWCVCRNEGSNVDDVVVIFIFVFIFVWLDVGMGILVFIILIKESFKVFFGIRECSGEEENIFFYGSELKM